MPRMAIYLYEFGANYAHKEEKVAQLVWHLESSRKLGLNLAQTRPL